MWMIMMICKTEITMFIERRNRENKILKFLTNERKKDLALTLQKSPFLVLLEISDRHLINYKILQFQSI